MEIAGLEWRDETHWLINLKGKIDTNPTDCGDELYNTSFAFVTSSRSGISHTLAHQRLGHQGYSLLPLTVAASRGINLVGEPPVDCTCQTCNLAKAHRIVSREERVPPNAFGDEIEADIQTLQESGGGNKYYVVFKDRKTGFLWTYSLARKGEAFTKFQQLRASLRTQYDVKIKTFHTDNDGSFGGRQLTDLLKLDGTNYTTTAPYTPEQNGGSERAGQEINRITRCLMIDGLIPSDEWENAVATATFLHN